MIARRTSQMPPRHRAATWVRAIAALVLSLSASDQPQSGSPLDRPSDLVWPAVNRWDDRLEAEYASFVAALGAAVEARRCRQLDECLRDPAANTTYEPAVDRGLVLRLDCADLPYVLRAYFAFKRRLPFAFVSALTGSGRDVRYATDLVPIEERTWRDAATPRTLLTSMIGRVHSGMYRLAPELERSDLYPVHIDRRAVGPGAIFYDPNGHVLVVARVTADGAVFLIDGHPDGGLTWKRFGAAYAVGTARLGGGFKRFRPLEWRDGRIVRARNAELPAFDPVDQYDRARRIVDHAEVPYHLWVRSRLTEAGATIDPVADLRDQIRALCRDVADRVDAVQVAVDAGLPAQPHPGWLPSNIYGAEGAWEIYSTPSRDARLKAAFREVRDAVLTWKAQPGLLPALQAIWIAETASASCVFRYTGSSGAPVTLRLADVLDRLFDLSFDPYHCPELRWGAPAGSAELAACPDGATKRAWYAAEARLRHRIDRAYGVPTPLDDGPDQPPDVDVQRALAP